MTVRMKLQSRVLLASLLPLMVSAIALISWNVHKTRELLMEEKKAQVRVAVDLAYGTLESLAREVNAGTLTEEQAKAQAVQRLRPQRFGNDADDYLFVYRGTTNVMLPPKPQLEGKDLSDMKDVNGKYFIRELAAVAERDGRGYVDYFWPDKKDSSRFVPKLSYVRKFSAWGWWIGTGIYVQEVDIQLMHDLRISVAAMGVFLMIVAAGVALWVRRGVTAPVEWLTRQVQECSLKIRRSAEATACDAERVSSASVQQAASLQETSSTLEEFNAMISRNLSHAENANSLSQDVRMLSAKGSQAMERLLAAIQRIESGNGKLTELAGIIQQVAERTQMVDDIAFQTSLLSFNASVEASRAGEHGRGFAIVAEEMGSLAEQSAEAATQIEEIVQTNVTSASVIRDENHASVTELLEKTKEVSEILSRIVEASRKVAEGSSQVVTASREQETGVRGINEAVSDINNATQDNSSAAQAVSVASVSLKEESEELEQLASEFMELVQGRAA